MATVCAAWQDKFDLRVVQGHGSHPRVLREAGADDADMLVAVTSSDETNMVAWPGRLLIVQYAKPHSAYSCA